MPALSQEDVEELCNDMAIMNEGKILVRTAPATAVQSLQGKIWTKVVTREVAEEMAEQHKTLSTSYNVDNSLNLRVFGEESPGDGFTSVAPQLQDVYFTYLNGYQS